MSKTAPANWASSTKPAAVPPSARLEAHDQAGTSATECKDCAVQRVLRKHLLHLHGKARHPAPLMRSSA